jgi:hypothetical protein
MNTGVASNLQTSVNVSAAVGSVNGAGSVGGVR